MRGFLSLFKLYHGEAEDACNSNSKDQKPDGVYAHFTSSSLGNINQPRIRDNKKAENIANAVIQSIPPVRNFPMNPMVKVNFATSKNSYPSFFLLSIHNHYKREVMRCLC